MLLVSTLALTLLVLTQSAWAWSNGGYSADPNNPDYGTHDWIAERALDWLPANEKALILTYRAVYLYGTELPDNCQAVDKLCDTGKHHVYFSSSGALQDNASARRASEMQSQALSAIAAGDYASAAKWSGAMTHYIADLASFGHVMGSGTDWGAEPDSVHSDYENHVQTLTNSRDASVIPLTFDGALATISPYDAAIALARDTTFDLSGMGQTAVWMNQTNDWNSPVFTARAYQSINLAVNYVAEAVHAVWSTVGVTTTTTLQQTTTTYSITSHVVINEFESNPPGDDNGSTEWVELFNPTNEAFDLSGWTLSPTNGLKPIVTIRSASIAPLGYYVVNRTKELGVQSGYWLNNDWEIIVLRDDKGNVIDNTSRADLADKDNNEYSWQRFPNGLDTNSDNDWSFRAATKGASNGGESIVTTTTTQQQTTTTSQQLTTTTTSATWSATTTTTQQVTTSTTQVETTTTSTQQQTTTSTTQQHTTTWTSQQYTTTATQTGSVQTFGMGFAFAVIGIGAGVAALGAGLAFAASGQLGSGVFAYGGYYYCRKHRVPVWIVGGQLWCPVERRFLRP